MPGVDVAARPSRDTAVCPISRLPQTPQFRHRHQRRMLHPRSNLAPRFSDQETLIYMIDHTDELGPGDREGQHAGGNAQVSSDAQRHTSLRPFLLLIRA
jgi:hypothetical protein